MIIPPLCNAPCLVDPPRVCISGGLKELGLTKSSLRDVNPPLTSEFETHTRVRQFSYIAIINRDRDLGWF